MKKLITLLLVLTGCVMSASAWNSAVLHYDGKWNSDDVFFTKINTDEFYIRMDGSVVRDGSFYFRFAVKGDGPSDTFVEKEPDTDSHNVDQEVTTTKVTSNYGSWSGSGHTPKAWYVSQDSKAAKLEIYIKWENDKWSITAVTLYNYTIIWKNDYNWSTVKAYTFDENLGDHRKIEELGAYGSVPSLSGTDGMFPVSFLGTPTVKAIFRQDDSNKTTNLNVVNNGVYSVWNSTDPYGITASISSVGYATFSSTKAVDFKDEKTIEACKASVDGNGKITYTPVTSVAAGEGVLLRRADRTIAAASSVIPLHANQEISRNGGNDLYGITAKQKIAQSTVTGYTNFILAKPDKELGFFKVNDNGSWCAAGTAYLKVANGNIPEPVTSRGFFALDDETTGIEAVNNVSTESANDAREYYNLNGQRVMNPSKGLYIVNGKKVIIK